MAGTWALTGCSSGAHSPTSSPSVHPTPTLSASPERALSSAQRAAQFLVSQQAPDGSWRSQSYRDMSNGYELTPIVAKALAFAGQREAAEKGAKFIETALDVPQKKVKVELIYPVYTASLTLLLIGRNSQHKVQAEIWSRYLLEHQHSEALGWKSSDPDFGGWGYSLQPPRKGNGDMMASSNLTSTTFAVGGLSYIGIPPSDPALKKALTFVQRCQGKDGGFFAAPGEHVINKAGTGVSYGSASCDGLRALIRCGGPESARQNVQKWILGHWEVSGHPGQFPKARWEDRDSLRFYYLWSLAHALSALQRQGQAPANLKQRGQEIVAYLESIQSPDGSFRNNVGASREDDPIVATAFALAALQLAGSW